MMNALDQQRNILLAVADHVGDEINLPSRVKIDWCTVELCQDIN